MSIAVVTPAQRRLVDDLLAWDAPRPAADPALAERLRATLEAGIADAVGVVPVAAPAIFVGKGSLDALVCDGRWLDREVGAGAASWPMVLGSLTHRAIELDWRWRRRRSPDGVVAYAWDEVATRTGSVPAFLNGLDADAAALLRSEVEQLLTEHRDTWPLLPAEAHVRLEETMRVELAGGRVVLQGTPDLSLGRVRDDRCRRLLVEFKTGWRRPMEERQELRFYALLATLKYGVAPFRWGVSYVREGAFDAEDLSEPLLESAVRRVVDGVRRMVRLRYDPPEELALVPGRWCDWCSRRETCPAVSQTDATLEA